MLHATRFRMLVPALLLALPIGAQETVSINFNQYASPTTTEYQAAIGAPVQSSGLDFYQATDFDATHNRNALGTWGTSDAGSVNRPTNIGSSTTLFGTALGGEIDILSSQSDAVFGPYMPFSLFSMDVAHLYSTAFSSIALQPFTMRFYAYYAGGDPFFQDFLINLPPVGQNGFRTPVLQTLTFDSRFQDVVNVYWNQGAGSGTATQFTNVVASTPEPSSMALLGTGLVGLGGVFKRRRRTATTA